MPGCIWIQKITNICVYVCIYIYRETQNPANMVWCTMHHYIKYRRPKPMAPCRPVLQVQSLLILRAPCCEVVFASYFGWSTTPKQLNRHVKSESQNSWYIRSLHLFGGCKLFHHQKATRSCSELNQLSWRKHRHHLGHDAESLFYDTAGLAKKHLLLNTLR